MFINIGEQLEQIDKQRSRADNARNLIQYFSEFNQNDISRLEKLKLDDKEGQYKVTLK